MMYTRPWSLVIALLLLAHISPAQTAKQLQASADSLLNLGNYSAALTLLNSILAADPANENALNSRSYIHYKQRHYTLAIVDAKTVLEKDRAKASSWNNVGWYLLLGGQAAEAKAYCEKAIDLNSADYSSYLNLGHIYAILQDVRMCYYYYTRAAEYMPSEQRLNEGALADFALLTKEKLFPWDTASFVHLFKQTWQLEGAANASATRIIDTIFNLMTYSGYAADDPAIVIRKKRFLKEEEQFHYWRYHIMADILWEQGIAEVQKRNYIKGGRDYLLISLGYTIQCGDTLAAIKRYLQFGRLYADQADIGLGIMKNALKFAPAYADTPLLSTVYFNIAEVSGNKKQYDSAVRYGRLAYRLALLGHDDNALFLAAGNLSTFFGAINSDSMTWYFDLAGRYATRPSVRQQFRNVFEYNHCSDLYNLARYSECAAYGLKIYQQHSHDTTADRAELAENIGLSYYKLGNIKLAAQYMQQAIDDYQLYTNTYPGDDAPSISRARAFCFKYLKTIRCQEKDMQALFGLGELSKSNDLLQRLAGRGVAVPRRTMAAEQQSLKADEAAIFFVNSGSIGYGYGIGFDKTKTALMTETAQRLDAFFASPAMQQFRTAITAAYKGRLAHVQGGTDDLAHMELLISSMFQLYKNLSTDNGTQRGLTMQNTGAVQLDIPGAMSMNDFLYNYYVQPFEAVMQGKTTLYICTEGITSIIPFEALQNSKGQYLGQLYRIVYLPSFTVRHLLQQRPAATSGNMLALGDPAYKDYKPTQTSGRANDLALSGFTNWADLPGTGQELDILRQIVPGITILQKADVTEHGIKALDDDGRLARYSYLHFAVHGMTSWDSYDDNSLILTEPAGTAEDGFLQFPEVAALSINTRLVCLSACETGIGLPKDNTDYSLITAFLMAGSRGVIASSWKIDDKATGIFMGELYRNIFTEKKDIPEALYLTRQKFITGAFGEQYKKPFYWAAFRYTGI